MIRNLFIAALLISGLYAAATIPLGKRTLAEHIKAIGQTQEAKDLIDGTKSKLGSELGPTASKIKKQVLDEVKQNMAKVQKEVLDSAGRPKPAGPSSPAKNPINKAPAPEVQGQAQAR